MSDKCFFTISALQFKSLEHSCLYCEKFNDCYRVAFMKKMANTFLKTNESTMLVSPNIFIDTYDWIQKLYGN